MVLWGQRSMLACHLVLCARHFKVLWGLSNMLVSACLWLCGGV
jgi:hypothetical protein